MEPTDGCRNVLIWLEESGRARVLSASPPQQQLHRFPLPGWLLIRHSVTPVELLGSLTPVLIALLHILNTFL